MSNENTSRPIAAWAEEDRPREKMLLKGRHSLSDAELLAILMGSGSRGESAVALAQRILASVENNLINLAKCTLQDFQKFNGVGEAKAISIAAALELGRRRQASSLRDRPRIKSSQDAYQLVAPLLTDLYHEEFWLLMLNKANEVTARKILSTGGMAGTVVDVKMVFKMAIDCNSAAIIAIHNHPSGNLTPSQSDIQLTKKISEAGKILDITLLDHLIVSDRGYYSFADQGSL